MPNRHLGWAKVIKGIVKTKRKKDPHNWRTLKVHDAACGTGELMERLREIGVPVSGSDLSEGMLLDQSLKCILLSSFIAEIDDKPVVMRIGWNELAGFFRELVEKQGPDERPNMIIVPGASIPYAGAWDSNPHTRDPARRELEIKVALHNFRESLRPDGVLIMTTSPESSFRFVEKYGKEIDEFKSEIYGKQVQIREVITHNPKLKIRKWRTTIEFLDSGEKQVIERNAFMLPPNELIRMCRELGFVRVRRIRISGEPYDGVIAEVSEKEKRYP